MILLFSYFLHGEETEIVQEKNPRTALFLGLTLPGSGQLYNGKWLKAAVYVSYDGYIAYKANDYHRLYKSYPFQIGFRDERNRYYWLLAAGWLAGAIDAYVDAHLSAFPKDSFSIIPENNGMKISISIIL
ncbi:MAG TPA: hypothetical protein ENN84_08870 [Candidatus Marinimicrobia bacterium]|nr:hypothetical protein [Candidatus Neomarinimicrobiota bacterium]